MTWLPLSQAILQVVRADVVNQIGLTGKIEKIRLSTFHGRDPDLIATKICFKLESEHGD